MTVECMKSSVARICERELPSLPPQHRGLAATYLSIPIIVVPRFTGKVIM